MIHHTPARSSHWHPLTLGTHTISLAGLLLLLVTAGSSAVPVLVPPAAAVVPGASQGISVAQGFDGCQGNGQPTVSQMQAFWTGTPYYNFYVYIGGSQATCGPANVTASWVNQVTNIGYSLLPVWVGPQAPCSGGSISYYTNTAYSQGTTEANATVHAAEALGFDPGTPIAYDLKGYNTQNSSCVAAVNAFLSGWNFQIGRGFWGYLPDNYGSSCGSNIQSWAHLSTNPSAVWIADYNGVDSVWNKSCLDNVSWSSDQRHAQYAGTHYQTYNNITLSIDSDCANGPVTPSPIFGAESDAEGNDPIEDASC